MREVSIEKYLVESVRRAGGVALKLVPFACKGVPDRCIILPGPWIVFCELKRPRGGRISEHQHWWRDKLIALGCEFRFVHTKAEVDTLLADPGGHTHKG